MPETPETPQQPTPPALSPAPVAPLPEDPGRKLLAGSFVGSVALNLVAVTLLGYSRLLAPEPVLPAKKPPLQVGVYHAPKPAPTPQTPDAVLKAPGKPSAAVASRNRPASPGSPAPGTTSPGSRAAANAAGKPGDAAKSGAAGLTGATGAGLQPGAGKGEARNAAGNGVVGAAGKAGAGIAAAKGEASGRAGAAAAASGLAPGLLAAGVNAGTAPSAKDSARRGNATLAAAGGKPGAADADAPGEATAADSGNDGDAAAPEKKPGDKGKGGTYVVPKVAKMWSIPPGQKLVLPDGLKMVLPPDIPVVPGTAPLTDEQLAQLRKMLLSQNLRQMKGLTKEQLKKMLAARKDTERPRSALAARASAAQPSEKKAETAAAAKPKPREAARPRGPREQQVALAPPGMTSPFRYRTWNPTWQERYAPSVRDTEARQLVAEPNAGNGKRRPQTIAEPTRSGDRDRTGGAAGRTQVAQATAPRPAAGANDPLAGGRTPDLPGDVPGPASPNAPVNPGTPDAGSGKTAASGNGGSGGTGSGGAGGRQGGASGGGSGANGSGSDRGAGAGGPALLGGGQGGGTSAPGGKPGKGATAAAGAGGNGSGGSGNGGGAAGSGAASGKGDGKGNNGQGAGQTAAGGGAAGGGASGAGGGSGRRGRGGANGNGGGGMLGGGGAGSGGSGSSSSGGGGSAGSGNSGSGAGDGRRGGNGSGGSGGMLGGGGAGGGAAGGGNGAGRGGGDGRGGNNNGAGGNAGGGLLGGGGGSGSGNGNGGNGGGMLGGGGASGGNGGNSGNGGQGAGGGGGQTAAGGGGGTGGGGGGAGTGSGGAGAGGGGTAGGGGGAGGGTLGGGGGGGGLLSGVDFGPGFNEAEGIAGEVADFNGDGNGIDTGYTPAVGVSPNFPEHNADQQKGIPGALVLPPLPPQGTEAGKLKEPRPVKVARRATLATPQQKERKTTPKQASSAVVVPPRRPEVTVVGSASRRGTVPVTLVAQAGNGRKRPIGRGLLATRPDDDDAPAVRPTKASEATPDPLTAPQSERPTREKKVANSKGIKEGMKTPLPPTPLPDSDAELGDGSGLRGEYYLGRNFEQFQFTRADKNLDLFWGGDRSPSPRLPIGADWSCRWWGRIQPRHSGTYTFFAVADDGVRVWINHRLVIDDWTLHPLLEYSGQIKLEAGKQYDIRVDYFESGGPPASIGIYWESDRQKKEFLPEECLYYPLPGEKMEMAKYEKPRR